MTPPSRHRGDLCPGVLRPWPADDGALVRLRLVGGDLSPGSLSALLDVARVHGDGNVHLTRRANLQLRALPTAPSGGSLPTEVVRAIAATGLLPSNTHELVRNIMVSPLTGLAGGRVDLRPLARDLDQTLCADPVYAGLSARFLFVLDDGRGDVAARSCDLGLVALDGRSAQLRIGDDWGPKVTLTDAVDHLLRLAERFVAARGSGPEAPWHVVELPSALAPDLTRAKDARAPSLTATPAHGTVPGTGGAVEHVAVPDGVITPSMAPALLGTDPQRLVITPWRSVLIVHDYPDPRPEE